jgi:outer membrane immunogenic protein
MMPRFLRVLGSSAFLGAILLAGALRAAVAADALPPPPPPLPPPPPVLPVPVVQVFSWTGFYVGGSVGWGFTNGSGTFTTALGPDPFTVTSNAFVGGAQVGYNWQAGPFVLGAEADFQGTSASGSLSANAGPAISATARTPWFGTLRGRVGYALDNILLYATGGGVYGDSSWSGSVSTVGNFSSATTFGTWTLGAGAEMAFWGCWSAKLEYLFVGTPSTTPTVPTVTAVSGNAGNNIIRLGANYHF